MIVDSEKLLKKYLEKVDEICEICDWKTSFSPKEIIGLVAEIIENDPSIIKQNIE